MHALLVTFHVLTCLALILIVLLQHGKGADIGVQFGASQTVFGARGAGNFLTKLTTGAAIVFMMTSFILSKLSARADVSEILDVPTAEAPAKPEVPASTLEPKPIESEPAPGQAEPSGAVPSDVPGYEQIEPPATQPAVPPAPPQPPAAPPAAPPPAR
jgi:preprotein translocase subunit SecG